MSLEGVDYSYARPGGAALVKAGKHFAMRYIAHPKGTPNLTLPELRDLQDHGLGVGLVCERGTSRMLGGSSAGAADAKLCKPFLSALGIPSFVPVYFAVDFAASTLQQPLIDDYLNGAADVLGIDRVGVYGSIYVVNRCLAHGTARWGWQTYAWSDGLVSPKAHILQYHNGQTINGAKVDFCRALKEPYGVWTPLPDSSTETDLERTITLREYPGGATRTVDGTNVTLYLPDGTTQKVATLSTIANADAEFVQSDDRAPKGTGWVRLAAKPYAGWYGIGANLKLGPLPAPTPDAELIAEAEQQGYERGYDVGVADTKAAAHIVPATISFE